MFADARYRKPTAPVVSTLASPGTADQKRVLVAAEIVVSVTDGHDDLATSDRVELGAVRNVRVHR